MGLSTTVVRHATENRSLSPASWALIAVGSLLVVAFLFSSLRAIVVRRGAWPWQPRPTPTPLPGPRGHPMAAAVVDAPPSPRRHSLSAAPRYCGLRPPPPRPAGRLADAPPAPPQPAATALPPVMRAVRNAIVGGTAPACPVEAPRRTCAVCLNRLSVDGGGEQPTAPRRAAGAFPWVCTLRCGHDFHAACVSRWAAREGAAASCPVCRKGVVGDADDGEVRTGVEEGGGVPSGEGAAAGGGEGLEGETRTTAAVDAEQGGGAGEAWTAPAAGSSPA